MKKFLVSSFIGALLFGAGAFAQDLGGSASHELEIVIPEVLMIRIDAAGASNVVFDYGTSFEAYFELLEDGSDGQLAPTERSFENVSVFANYEAWLVTVEADGDALVSERVSVRPAAPSRYMSVERFGLNGDTIARGSQTQGWRPLGIAGSDYLLAVDGTETPGTYTATITYSISTP
jgi:hypothetical protein